MIKVFKVIGIVFLSAVFLGKFLASVLHVRYKNTLPLDERLKFLGLTNRQQDEIVICRYLPTEEE